MLTNRELLKYLLSLPVENLDKPVAVYSYNRDGFYACSSKVQLAGQNCADLYRSVEADHTIIYLQDLA